jgi:hypothetical protein
MRSFTSARPRLTPAAPVAGVLIATLTLAGQAHATCLSENPAHPAAQALVGVGRLTPAVYRPEDTAHGALVRVSEPAMAEESIVGVWQYQFELSDGSSDWGTQTWHSDGSEIIYSTGVNPEQGNVCQGAWQQTGARTYSLNHVAMGWLQPGVDPTQGNQFVRAHFHFVVVLDPSGNRYTGRFTEEVYLEVASDPFNEDPRSNPPIASLTGTVTATRLSPDP